MARPNLRIVHENKVGSFVVAKDGKRYKAVSERAPGDQHKWLPCLCYEIDPTDIPCMICECRFDWEECMKLADLIKLTAEQLKKDGLESGPLRVRRAYWTSPHCYLKLTVFPNGTTAPWTDLFDDAMQEKMDYDTPQRSLMLTVADGPEDDWATFEGNISAGEDKMIVRNSTRL